MSPVTLYVGLHPFVHSACCKQRVSQNAAAQTTACCPQLQARRSEHSPVCIVCVEGLVCFEPASTTWL